VGVARCARGGEVGGVVAGDGPAEGVVYAVGSAAAAGHAAVYGPFAGATELALPFVLGQDGEA
jgi:hypothetical protein